MTPQPAWIAGIPVHAAALREGGADFLTAAFRASGALGADNAVRRITECVEVGGGSTGRKLLLGVEYQQADPALHRDLFVKFSRDLDDPVRDRGRTQMQLEVRFARLSRAAGFPIAVPACYHADYDEASGTGVLITQRIAYGRNGIEPHYPKCLDHRLPDPLAHYEALLRSLARLAGAHRAGRLPAALCAQLPFDPAAASGVERAPYTAQQLQTRVDRYAAFAAQHPQLLSANIRAADFIARLRREAVAFAGQQAGIRAALNGNVAHIALCHWNANIDNAWFWRDAAGELQCGLMDWGCVGPMNLAMALWGALSGAESGLWDKHLDGLLVMFSAEFETRSGVALELATLRRELMLYVAIMGLNWLLDVPAYLATVVAELARVQDRHDPRIEDNEAARTSLTMLGNFLNLWETQDFGALLRRYEAA
ncbi:MAG TPA: hypothetical protein VGE51_12235 [Fontimonas sp.]